MSEEQKPRDVRLVDNPDRPGFPHIVTAGSAVRMISVSDTPSWSEDDVALSLTTHDIRGSSTQTLRVTDSEAVELLGKLGTHLLAKGLVTVVPPKDVTE